jgi:hypothetical protein
MAFTQYIPSQEGLRTERPVSFSAPFSTTQGNQASLQDRKKYIQYNPAFSGSSVCVLCSSNRVSGTINNAIFRLPRPVSAYAASLKSLILPVTWYNVQNILTFNVTYSPGGQPYPGDFTLEPGNYTYNLYQGEVTYSFVNAQPIYVNANDLAWILLRWFSGALTSITINPTNGGWTWVWNSALTSVTSSDLPNFFQITEQEPLVWLGTNPVDLVGPRDLLISSPELSANSYFSTSAPNQSYICSCPVNATYGDVLVHEPSQEIVNYFANEKPISIITISIQDAHTSQLIPLTMNWVCEIRLYSVKPVLQ